MSKGLSPALQSVLPKPALLILLFLLESAEEENNFSEKICQTVYWSKNNLMVTNERLP